MYGVVRAVAQRNVYVNISDSIFASPECAFVEHRADGTAFMACWSSIDNDDDFVFLDLLFCKEAGIVFVTNAYYYDFSRSRRAVIEGGFPMQTVVTRVLKSMYGSRYKNISPFYHDIFQQTVQSIHGEHLWKRYNHIILSGRWEEFNRLRNNQYWEDCEITARYFHDRITGLEGMIDIVSSPKGVRMFQVA